MVDELVAFYIERTNNNANNTIILEKNYMDFLYFQKSIKNTENLDCAKLNCY